MVRLDADTASAKIGNLIQGEQVVALQEESLPDGEKGNRVLIHLIRRVNGNVMHLQGWVSKVSESVCTRALLQNFATATWHSPCQCVFSGLAATQGHNTRLY
eukprot:COSAG01_NODE_10285_length_2200_cov_17.519752_2_plen_102_part_00